jgi:hypothetical protein
MPGSNRKVVGVEMNLKNAYRRWRESEHRHAAQWGPDLPRHGRGDSASAVASPGLAVLARIASQRSLSSRWSW